ncbi:UNVERIFIED_CONTAM: hypothetical protein FKN15_060350 [Acipenser sinensis]
MSRCQILSSSPVFLKCAHIVDPEPFVSMCEDDTCHCHKGPECQCHAFLEYARTCAQRGVILKGWPTESHCSPRCPFGMEYNECISPCSHTCQSLNINEVCKEGCEDGCSCPEGKVLDGEHCVDSSQCSCTHTGRRYPPGSSIAQDCNTCICRHGLWECSNEECPGECFVTGQSHFKSFDNKFFTFSGVCQYLFAKDCQDNEFAVVIETVQCFQQGPPGPLRIQHTVMSSVRLTYNEDFQLDWDGRGKLLLKLSPAYSGKMCGLCGNYNGNQGDDFLTPAGLAEAQVGDFGNSWKINGECEDVTKQDLDPCSLNPKRVRYAEACSVLTSPEFEPCHYEVNPAPFVKNCRYDVCSCSDGKECLCSAVSSYATACARKGVLINWRTPDFCEMSCAEDHVYQQCGSPCNQTCRSLSFPDMVCLELCMEGCYCPPGLYANDHGECVPSSQCACHYDGDVFQPGDVFSSHFTICQLKGTLDSCVCTYEWSYPAEMSCAEDHVYQQCGSPCNQTCRSLSFPDMVCLELCMEGCYCPPGLYANDHGECVPSSQCACHYDGDVFQPGDVFSSHFTICSCEEGSMHCSSSDLPSAMLSDLLMNDLPSTRVRRALSCRPPMRKSVCSSPREEGIECTKTCQNYDLECVSQGCISGCTCPPGRGLDGGLVGSVIVFRTGMEQRPEAEVPALASLTVKQPHWPTECYNVDMLVNSVCQHFSVSQPYSVCRDRKWECTNQVCDGSCKSIGEANYLTFDGVKYTFPGLCQYVLVQDYCNGNEGTFRILVENSGCGVQGQRCSKVTMVLYEGGVIELANGVVTMRKPVKDETEVEIIRSGLYFILLLGKGISVTWDLGTRVTVQLKGQYRNKVCGLCGNFDGVQNNDLQSSNNQMEVEPSDFGNSWKVNPGCADAVQLPSQCSDSIMKQVSVEQSCNVLVSELFKECNKLVDPEPYWDICTYDTCSCPSIGDCVCFCDAVAAYAQECAQHGVLIHWRSNSLCPLSCEELNAAEPEFACEWSHCEGNNLSCKFCPLELVTTLAPTTLPVTTSYRDLVTTPVPENVCSRMMDLAFMVDGSSSLTEDDFETVKDFIINVAERFRMGAAYTRMTVMQFHTGIKSYEMQVQKPVFKKVVKEMKYSGGEAAFINEALKYLALNIFDKDKREDASRVAVLLTASTSPRKIKGMLKLLSKKSITMISIGLGPYISMDQINQITSNSPSNKAVILNSVNGFIEYLARANGTHLAVLQYGRSNSLEVSWVDRQSKENLISSVNLMQQREAAPTRLGDALRFTVQSAISEVHGGRPGVPKIAVLIATRPSQDPVEEAAREALTAGMCMGSSTSHIVTFDGLAFKLTGSCSYTLLRDAVHGSDIILHNAPCSADFKQSCMKSIEVKHAGTSIALRDDMKVTLYGALMHEVKIPSLGYVLTFTPGNNEFTVQLTPMLRTTKTSGLCGFCDQNEINDFALKDGSVTLESHVFIKEWTIEDPSGPSCEPVASLTCTHSASDQCLVLRSSMFQRCHAAVPPAPYIVLCQEASCHGQDLCQIVAAYSHLCRLQGVCINWRSEGFCAQQCPSSMVFDSCRTGCIQQCAGPFNSTMCMDTPTEGCFCPPGKVLNNGECVEEEACSQCLDENRVAHKHLDSWIPAHDPCQICMCLDNRNINCTVRPCSNTRAPVCGACEVLTKKRDSDQCCQEYECVCDLVSCDLPLVPTCADGMSVVLTNPGECKSVYECACKKEICKLEPKPSCPAHRKLSARETQCCDQYECTCNCVNSTVTCPPGYLSTSVTNDCGCTAVSCLPDNVMCDLVSCDLPLVPTCADGMSVVLTNPGECKSVYECACKKEICKLEPKPSCPPHRKLSARETQCCDQYECTCNCVNSTVTCPPGYLSTSVTNDCGCTAVSCLPDNVCVHHEVVYQVGSIWEEACKTCSCTDKQDKVTALHIVDCTEKVCNEICPVGTSYTTKDGECCGKCKKSACQEHFVGGPLADMDSKGRLRHVGERWRSAQNPCVISECMQVNEEVFINQQNLSCSQLDTPHCPPGTTLQCDTFGDCCPSCHCAPMDGCVMNNTVIGSGETFMVDECSRCQCSVETGVIKRYRLLCGKVTCTPCQEGYRMEKVNGSCCGKCIATTCSFSLKDGTAIRLQAGETREDGCTSSLCKVDERGDFVLETKVTSCPPFDKDKCVADGGKVVQLGKTCCETCAEPECKQTVGILKYIKIDDCMSENQVDLHYCEVLNNFIEGNQPNTKNGLYFRDGKRKVDYVLAYNYRTHVSIKSALVSQGLAVISNGNSVNPEGKAQVQTLQSTQHEQGLVVEVAPQDLLEDDRRCRREAFERNLVEAGLEIEKDEEIKNQGTGFVRIHAPWHALSREAEFLKIKVPTKQVYEVKEQDGMITALHKVWHKITRPFEPKIKNQGTGFVRIHAPWHALSREAEFLKIKVPTKQVYEVKEQDGMITALHKVWHKITRPFEPKVQHLENDTKTKHISYDFTREKIHLKYFGENIGLYFAWLGVYTELLIPASVVGIIVFLYGCATLDTNIPSLEMCEYNFTMCPLCDQFCDYWNLSTACSTAKASHLFDNPATVFFSVFMALWGIHVNGCTLACQMYLEERPRPEYETKLLQKNRKKGKQKNRKRSKTEAKKEEENRDSGKNKWREKVLSTMGEENLFGLTFSAVFGVIVYRITTSAIMAMSSNPSTRANVRVTVTSTAVIINLVVILILDEIYGAVAKWLTQIEIPKTEKSFEERLIVKSFLLKFMNAYAPIFYVAFFKGRAGPHGGQLPGGRYGRCPVQGGAAIPRARKGGAAAIPRAKKGKPTGPGLKGPGGEEYRLSLPPPPAEEEQPELSLPPPPAEGEHMELSLPPPQTEGEQPELSLPPPPAEGEQPELSLPPPPAEGEQPELSLPPPPAEGEQPELSLPPSPGVACLSASPGVACLSASPGVACLSASPGVACLSASPGVACLSASPGVACLSASPGVACLGVQGESFSAGSKAQPCGVQGEPFSAVIQFGFVTLFVASFPLAPLFALLNNVIEIRLDAKKFVTELRRPNAVRAKNIGIWYNILSGMGKLSVIINAFVISFTSDFIPRLVYQYLYSETGTMDGFIDHTLSYFNVSHFKPGSAPVASEFHKHIGVCRYRDYREPPWSSNPYGFSKQYWSLLAARLAFVILFQVSLSGELWIPRLTYLTLELAPNCCLCALMQHKTCCGYA